MSVYARECFGCGWIRPTVNVLPPHPQGIDELGLRVNAAILSGKLTWGQVAIATGPWRTSIEQLSDMFQGRSPISNPDLCAVLEAMLDDVDRRYEGE